MCLFMCVVCVCVKCVSVDLLVCLLFLLCVIVSRLRVIRVCMFVVFISGEFCAVVFVCLLFMFVVCVCV